jgi:hypothetical protein
MNRKRKKVWLYKLCPKSVENGETRGQLISGTKLCYALKWARNAYGWTN